MRLSLSAGTWWDFFGSNSLHVSTSPLANRLQRALERPAIFRQRVFHFRRNGGINAPRNDAIGLQLAELLYEHLFRNSGNQPAQFRKAASKWVRKSIYKFSYEDADDSSSNSYKNLVSHRLYGGAAVQDKIAGILVLCS